MNLVIIKALLLLSSKTHAVHIRYVVVGFIPKVKCRRTHPRTLVVLFLLLAL
jgi:hypothetical protein